MSGEDPQLVKQQRSLAARLQSDWANLLGDEETADMELLAGTERIPVHRLVLRTRCGRLWDRLKEEKSVDGERTTLGFPHLSPKAVKIVVRYLYTAKVVGEEVVSCTCQLLSVCHEFSLPELSSYFLHALHSWLRPENVCPLLVATRKAAAYCSNGSLVSADLRADIGTVLGVCMEYIHRNISAILETEGILSLDRDALVSILSSENVSASLEVVLKAIIRWGKKKAGVSTALSDWTAEERKRVKDEVQQLLQHVDCELVGEVDGHSLSGLLESPAEESSKENCDNGDFPNSTILKGQEDMQAQLHEWCGSPADGWRLLYRASNNNYSAKCFHQKCDGKGATVVIVKSTDGSIFGGYSDVQWNSAHRRGKFSTSNRAFLFSLVNLANLLPTKLEICQPAYAINNHPNNGPIFGAGADLYISNECNMSDTSYSQLDSSYSCSSFPSLTLASTKYFMVEEYEVYGVNIVP